MNYIPAFLYTLKIVEVHQYGFVTYYSYESTSDEIQITNNIFGSQLYLRAYTIREAMYYRDNKWVVGGEVVDIVTCKTMAITNNKVHLFQ